MDTNETVRNRIIELCKSKRWKINALARFAGIPPSTMRNIANGHTNNIGIVTIKKICDGLEITLPEFFTTPEFENLEQEIM